MLVIDDLDRIDPEHIFRLFNVFSAHLDYDKSTGNKFGFDKVIFVCDIHNIRNIFHSRYGADTDFTGYIDKFYNQEVYHFDNTDGVKAVVTEFLHGILPTTEFKEYYLAQIVPVSQGSRLLSILLTELIHSGALTIRRLNARYGTGFPHVVTNTGLRAPYDKVYNWTLPAVIVLEVLRWIVGDLEALDRALKKLLFYQRSNEYLSRTHREQGFHVATLLPVLDYTAHGFQTHHLNHTEEAHPYEFTAPRTQQRLNYGLYLDQNTQSIYMARIKKVNDEPYHDQKLDLFGLVYQTFTMLRAEGILR